MKLSYQSLITVSFLFAVATGIGDRAMAQDKSPKWKAQAEAPSLDQVLQLQQQQIGAILKLLEASPPDRKPALRRALQSTQDACQQLLLARQSEQRELTVSPARGQRFSPQREWPVRGRTKGNNGIGNGIDPQPPGNPPVNDGIGTSPGNPGRRRG